MCLKLFTMYKHFWEMNLCEQENTTCRIYYHAMTKYSKVRNRLRKLMLSCEGRTVL
jgi:hypothetical protein